MTRLYMRLRIDAEILYANNIAVTNNLVLYNDKSIRLAKSFNISTVLLVVKDNDLIIDNFMRELS